MRIGIDMSSVSVERTGIGCYAVSLVRALNSVDSENIYFLYLRDECFKEFSGLRENFIKKKIPCGKRLRLPRVHLYLSYAIARDKLNLFYSPNYLLPLFCPVRSVITIHDLTHIILPEKHRRKQLLLFNVLLPKSVKGCSRIIAVSENTKRDIVRIFKVSEEKITVVHEAADEVYKPVENGELISRTIIKYGISSEFILFVGTLEPRKNITGLIEAFDFLKKEKHLKHKLVIIGKKGWKYDKIFESAEKSDFKNEIIFTGYVPEEDLVYLYNGADVFVYPSLYEGFGLPPLEAMACGTPVITSKTSSLPEVVGDAAILVDPDDIRQLSDAIDKVLASRELKSDLIKKGLKKANLFSWRKAAKKVSEIFKIR